MIGETKAATDGAGSAEWRAAADCRGLMNLAGRSAAPGPGPGVPGDQAGGAPLISWPDTGPGHHTAGCQAPAFLL